jgi:hypothetical protein
MCCSITSQKTGTLSYTALEVPKFFKPEVANQFVVLFWVYMACGVNSIEHNQLLGRAMPQAASRRPRTRASPCGICGERCGTGTGFSRST